MTAHRGLARRIRGAARAVRAAPPPVAPPALRQATVVSHDADGTMTVLLDGGNVPGTRRAGGGWLPPPDGGLWVTGRRPNLWALCSTDDRVGFSPRAQRGSVSIVNNTGTAIPWTSVEGVPTPDVWDFWVAGAPTDLVLPATGRYSATLFVEFAAGTTGYRSAWIEEGGVVIARDSRVPPPTVPAYITVDMPARAFVKGDVVKAGVSHTQGAALALTQAHLSVTYLGPA